MKWACSSVGRVFGSHPKGREFESLQVHQKRRISSSFPSFNFTEIRTGHRFIINEKTIPFTEWSFNYSPNSVISYGFLTAAFTALIAIAFLSVFNPALNDISSIGIFVKV